MAKIIIQNMIYHKDKFFNSMIKIISSIKMRMDKNKFLILILTLSTISLIKYKN